MFFPRKSKTKQNKQTNNSFFPIFFWGMGDNHDDSQSPIHWPQPRRQVGRTASRPFLFHNWSGCRIVSLLLSKAVKDCRLARRQKRCDSQDGDKCYKLDNSAHSRVLVYWLNETDVHHMDIAGTWSPSCGPQQEPDLHYIDFNRILVSVTWILTRAWSPHVC